MHLYLQVKVEYLCIELYYYNLFKLRLNFVLTIAYRCHENFRFITLDEETNIFFFNNNSVIEHNVTF